MNILVACEESQEICKAFRSRGHNAYSCDLLPCSGGFPEFHILGDCMPLINGNCTFHTMDGVAHVVNGPWDLLIAHVPCTYFSNATMVNLGRKDKPHIYNEEWKENFYRQRDKYFNMFLDIWNCNAKRICIENVVGYLNTHFSKPSQIIQPFWFGTPIRKATCLWLKNLPPLVPTSMCVPVQKWVKSNLKNGDDLKGYSRKGVYGSRKRSKTFPSIAEAIASQWNF